MAITAPPPVNANRRDSAPALIARARFRWQGRRALIQAVSGQAGTLTRAATGTAIDTNGVSYTAVHSMPRWEARDRDGDAESDREALGLRLGADDLSWPMGWQPETASILLEMAEAGTRTTSGAGLLYIGNDGQTNARLAIDSDGTNYRATLYNNAGASTSVSLTGAAPATDRITRFALYLDDDGTLQRIRLIAHVLTTAGEIDTGWSTTIARAATWGAGAKLRVNRLGNAGTQGSTWLSELAWIPGHLTADQMQARL